MQQTPLILILLFSVVIDSAYGHGSITPEDDVCILQVGFLKAHFKIFLPRVYQHEEFCEELPVTGEVLFVMEYEHESLEKMLIDFRIIRDVTGQRQFAREVHVAKVTDLDEATVFHHPARVVPDVFTVVHQFDEPGWYIGIVTATTEAGGRSYTAVFPFEVGFTGYGTLPLFAFAILMTLVLLWYEKRSFDARYL